MTTPWTSANGLVLADRVPAELRARWVARGLCPDRDLYTLFSERVRAHPRRDAVIDESGTLDYASLDAEVRRVAARLADAGLGRTDIIGIQLRNGRTAVIAELAVAALGAVALPYPHGRDRSDTAALLGRSRAAAVLSCGAAAARLVEVANGLAYLREVLVFGTAEPGCRSLDGSTDGEDEDAGAGVEGPRFASPDPEAPARILVSSGSEAEPKMVAYSHNAMAGGRGGYVGALHEGPGPMRGLLLVSLASSYGSLGTSVVLARHGGTLILPDAFEPSAAMRMATRHRPTHVFGVPTMLRRMAESPVAEHEDFSSVRAVVASGAAVHPDTLRVCRKRFGAPMIGVYGSADGVNCHTARDEASLEEGRIGRPDPDVAELRIANTAGVFVAKGAEGEIWALGPMSPLCYVGAPELDAEYRAPGGWVRTGDRGRFEPDDRLRVLGRLKRLVNRGGRSISPLEVERQISAHPAVADVACVSTPDADLGERMCACVVQRPGTAPITLTELTAFLEAEREVERAKLPEHLLLLAKLPLGPTEKACHRTLTELATRSVRSGPARRSISDAAAR